MSFGLDIDMVFCVFGIMEFSGIYFLCGEISILLLIQNNSYIAHNIELHKNK
jgi:hypothetical protein